MNPIRVVAIMEAYSVTGPAKNLLRFAKRLKERSEEGVVLSILTFYRGSEASPSNQFLDAVQACGVEVDVIREQFAFDPGIRPQLAAAIRKRAPHIVQTHAVKAHFLFRISGLHSGRQWIAFHHGYTAEDFKMKLYNQLNRFSLPGADRVITVCTPFSSMLAQRGVSPARLFVLPNSIEPAVINKAEHGALIRQQFGIPQHARLLLSVGRFSREKGHADLIPAMVQLRQTLPDTTIRHILVGDGPEREALRQLATAAGVQENFVFAGHHKNVVPFYAAADVFILPSHSEGSPNVLLEAMAGGLPIVACSVGGVPETVTHDASALLVQPQQPQAIAAATARILSDRTVADSLGRTAAEVARSSFSPDTYFNNLVTLYRQMLGQNQHA